MMRLKNTQTWSISLSSWFPYRLSLQSWRAVEEGSDPKLEFRLVQIILFCRLGNFGTIMILTTIMWGLETCGLNLLSFRIANRYVQWPLSHSPPSSGVYCALSPPNLEFAPNAYSTRLSWKVHSHFHYQIEVCNLSSTSTFKKAHINQNPCFFPRTITILHHLCSMSYFIITIRIEPYTTKNSSQEAFMKCIFKFLLPGVSKWN